MQARQTERCWRAGALVSGREPAHHHRHLEPGGVVALTAIAAFLAAAETGLTRMSRARAHLREEHAAPPSCWPWSSSRPVSQPGPPARAGGPVLRHRPVHLGDELGRRGGLGVVIAATVMTIVWAFICAEVAPKTYAVQHTDRAALFVALFVYFLTACSAWGS